MHVAIDRLSLQYQKKIFVIDLQMSFLYYIVILFIVFKNYDPFYSILFYINYAWHVVIAGLKQEY